MAHGGNELEEFGVGGIVGQAYTWTNGGYSLGWESTVSNSYNTGNVTSSIENTGGIVGNNNQYCKVLNCYTSSIVQVKYTGVTPNSLASNNIGGNNNNYLGKIIGKAYSENSEYVNGNDILSSVPTVYDVVKGVTTGNSEYWSNIPVTENGKTITCLKWQFINGEKVR